MYQHTNNNFYSFKFLINYSTVSGTIETNLSEAELRINIAANVHTADIIDKYAIKGINFEPQLVYGI